MAVDVTPPASRNVPCPCGSGRRCKECHGAVGTGPAAVPGPLDRILARALADQQAGGRAAQAIAGYEAALVRRPAEALFLPCFAALRAGSASSAAASKDAT